MVSADESASLVTELTSKGSTFIRAKTSSLEDSNDTQVNIQVLCHSQS